MNPASAPLGDRAEALGYAGMGLPRYSCGSQMVRSTQIEHRISAVGIVIVVWVSIHHIGT